MKTSQFILPALLALGACQPAAEPGETPAEAPQASVTPDAPPAGAGKPNGAVAADPPAVPQRLPIGEYRVAGADGADIDLPHGITVSVDAATIAVASQCVTPRWTYRYVEGRLRTEPIVEPICDRGRYPAEEALSAVFGDPREITRTAANGIEIAGGGHSVTLFGQ